MSGSTLHHDTSLVVTVQQEQVHHMALHSLTAICTNYSFLHIVEAFIF